MLRSGRGKLDCYRLKVQRSQSRNLRYRKYIVVIYVQGLHKNAITFDGNIYMCEKYRKIWIIVVNVWDWKVGFSGSPIFAKMCFT